MVGIKKTVAIVSLLALVAAVVSMLRNQYRDHRSVDAVKRSHQSTPGGLMSFASHGEQSGDAFAHVVKKEPLIPIAILGSGPAGLSAALYGARAGTLSIVFAGPKPMGLLTETSDIENWPGVSRVKGMEVMQRLQDQAVSFGAQVVPETIKKVDLSQWPFKITTEEGMVAYALSLIVATGASPRKLGVEGEVTYWGKGVTTCAVCDAPYYKDGKVIVVGGGDSAAEEAMQLAPYAASIKIMVRSDAMRASKVMQDRLKAYNNIEIIYNTQVTAIKGDGTHVQEVELMDSLSGSTSSLKIDGVFLAIGHVPNTDFFGEQLPRDEAGLILLRAPSQATYVQGVFAAGEASDGHYRQAGVAAGDGIKAALDALEFLRELGFNEQVAKELKPYYYNPKRRSELQPLEQIDSLQALDKILPSGVVLLDFYADYCPSCMQMMPAMEDVADEFKGKARIVKIDASHAQDIAKIHMVTSLPTLLLYKDGHLVARHNKAKSKIELRALLTAALESKSL